jgi:peptide/nickel transport system substrate-binding protein
MKQPCASFPEQLAAFWYYLYIAPADFHPARPNGTGPFAYQSFTPGQQSVFTRNPHYFKAGLPYAETLTILDFAPFDPDYDRSWHRVQDLPQARFLLKQAGRSDLAVPLVTSAISTGTTQMATVLAQQATAAGVRISLRTVQPDVFFGPSYLRWTFAQDYYNYSPYLAQAAFSMLPGSPFNETHTDSPEYSRWYAEANATFDPARRRALLREMQEFDFTRGGYIIPAFIDSLDAYSTKITGYTAARVGQPLSNFDFEHFAFAG